MDALDLAVLCFEGAVPEATGRPAYHPGTLLKIYLYGYLNRIQSSRPLEREAHRNLELMWLTGGSRPTSRPSPISARTTGRQSVRPAAGLPRLDLFSEAVVAVDGSKFKAVNNRDKNFTPHKLQKRIEQVEASIARYLAAMETADRHEDEVLKAKSTRLKEKIASLREQARRFRDMEPAVRAAPDQQISLTDPDARSMATSGRGTGIVGYNVQAAVDTKHHLIVAHEVTNIGNDRAQLSAMAGQAREAMGQEALTVIADRGYFDGEEIVACEGARMTPLVPQPMTSAAKADGRFGNRTSSTCPSKTPTAALPARP